MNTAYKVLFCGLLYLSATGYVKGDILQINTFNQFLKTPDVQFNSSFIKHIRRTKKLLQWESHKYKICRLFLQKWRKADGFEILLISSIVLSLILITVLVVFGLIWLAQFLALWLVVLLALFTLLIGSLGTLLFVISI